MCILVVKAITYVRFLIKMNVRIVRSNLPGPFHFKLTAVYIFLTSTTHSIRYLSSYLSQNSNRVIAFVLDAKIHCVRSSECPAGYCCARHHYLRVCRPLLKEDDVSNYVTNIITDQQFITGLDVLELLYCIWALLL